MEKSRKIKSKKNRKIKSSIKQKGGQGDIITQDEIREKIENDGREICGYIDTTGEHYHTANGTPRTEFVRGSCSGNIINPNDKVIQWHTHPIESKYYPSFEDIMKVITDEHLRRSVIYTRFGYWTLMRLRVESEPIVDSEPIVELKPEEKREIKIVYDTVNQLFYEKTEKGRVYNEEVIHYFTELLVRQINTYLPEGVVLQIYWSTYE